MGLQLTDNAEALRLFFTDDVYLINGDTAVLPVEQEVLAGVQSAAIPIPEAIAIPEPAIVKFAQNFKYMGKNQKNVLILVNDTQNDVSSERGRELLRNIVKSIQLSANDFALVNYSSYEHTSFSEFASFFSCRLVLVFGVNPVKLGLIEHPKNTLIMESSAQLVFSDDLDLLAIDQNGKKTLWGSLKQLSI